MASIQKPLDIEISPNTQKIIDDAIATARSRGHREVGTEHIMAALLRLNIHPINQQEALDISRAASWVFDRVCDDSNSDSSQSSKKIQSLLEENPIFKASDNIDPQAEINYTQSMKEIWKVTESISKMPVLDGQMLYPDGYVASEFLLAAILFHGCNVAADILCRVSHGRVSTIALLPEINIKPEQLYVKRIAMFEAKDIKVDGVTHLDDDTERPRKRFLLGSQLPNPTELPQAPTRTSNWLIPGHLCIGAAPKAKDMPALLSCGITTFVCLIGEYWYAYDYPSGARDIASARFVRFGINDFDVPDAKQLGGFVLYLRELMSGKGECVFVHCYGGHGRTGTVVIPLVSSLYNLDMHAARSFVEAATCNSRQSNGGYHHDMPETDEQLALCESTNNHVRLRSRKHR
eukprot:m.93945 g.93945  ORF g.93945 m.93945 type:complete len:405 (+) comp13421_c1_seq4:83-1297(+)